METHNTREVEEIVEEFKEIYGDYMTGYFCCNGSECGCNGTEVDTEAYRWLRTTLHQQLQKARLDEYGKGFEDGMRAAQGLHTKYDSINGLMTEIEEMAGRHQDEPKPIDCYGRTIDTSFITTPLDHPKLDQDKK